MGDDSPGELRTDRLVLEPLTVEHAEEMVVVLADADLYGFIGGAPPDLDELVDRYERQTRGSGRSGERWCNWIMRRSDVGAAIGYVQATVTGDTADVAWVVGLPHQGQGFASEATTAMVGWLTEHGVGRVTAHVAPAHVRSARVAASVGLERTGAVDDDGEEVWASATQPSGARPAT